MFQTVQNFVYFVLSLFVTLESGQVRKVTILPLPLAHVICRTDICRATIMWDTIESDPVCVPVSTQ